MKIGSKDPMAQADAMQLVQVLLITLVFAIGRSSQIRIDQMATVDDRNVTCPGKSGPSVVRISTWHLGEGHAKKEDLTREDHFAAAAD